MRGDFARVTFDPSMRFTQVLQHQGRVQLEADWNEQGAIFLHLLRSLIVDIAGPCWRPSDGFKPEWDAAEHTLKVGPGHAYVDGVLCENDTTVTFATQPWRPPPATDSALAADSEGVFFLDAWERHVTALEAPSLRETALGGVETTSRAQAVWQVRFLTLTDIAAQLEPLIGALEAQRAAAEARGDAARAAALQALKDAAEDARTKAQTQPPAYDCKAAQAFLRAMRSAPPRLRARVRPGPANDDPCEVAPDSGYRGRENQLYRVEVHDPGRAGDGASFKWSRENASLDFPIVSVLQDGSAARVRLASLGRDARLGLCSGDWVEVVDDDAAFSRLARPLMRVRSVDRGELVVVLEGQIDPPQAGRHARLRRWDQTRSLTATGAVKIIEPDAPGGWIDLEDGLQVQFEPGGLYETGDYWTIPTRVGIGVEWPLDRGSAADPKPALAVVPHGVTHHLAPLAVLSIDNNGVQTLASACGCVSAGICPPGP